VQKQKYSPTPTAAATATATNGNEESFHLFNHCTVTTPPVDVVCLPLETLMPGRY
tara:strand:+ start:205 stop:369 length:165 start_codon:yes stop_codon:yes gene_type:complete